MTHAKSFSRRRAAFTLVELMISIGLVVVLMLGINQVFSYTSKAVGSGESLNAATRNSRAAQGTFAADFAALVAPGNGPGDSGCMILQSSTSLAFQNADDEKSSNDVLKRDMNNDGTAGDPSVPGEVVKYATYDSRNHRVDTFAFFARDKFQRQTGNYGTIASDMVVPEAWIWYGHLNMTDQQPATAGTFPTSAFPRAQNPYNYYANQFVLGRVAILLKPYGSSATLTDSHGVIQSHITPSGAALAPLSYGSTASMVGEPNVVAYSLQDSRLDLAATSIEDFRTKVVAAGSSFWSTMMTPSSLSPNARFKCNPFVNRPLDAGSMAQASPAFLPGCSQFIVEFAGDYRRQINDPTSTFYGNPDTQPNGQDGEVDYVIINGRRQTCWYGMPRNTSGQTGINAANGDTVPIRWWLPANYPAFEIAAPTQADVAANNPLSPYVAAWGPNDQKPKLIRITILLEDPNGRLPEGLTYQYVFPIP